MNYVFTYVPSSQIAYKTDVGMSLKEYSAEWHKKYAECRVEFGFNSVAGYTTGLCWKRRWRRRRAWSSSNAPGDVQPLGQPQDAGRHVRARSDRAQIGEITPLGQLVVESTIS